MRQTGKNIILDFRQPVAYLFPAIAVAIVGIIIYKKLRREEAEVSVPAVLFFIYLEVIVELAFFSREPGSRNGIDMDLFGTWGDSAIAHAYFLENVMMFIPFGFLVPLVVKRTRKAILCVSAGFLVSCTIEISQLLTQRGYCQLDDVVTNTAGTLLGWMIWKCLRMYALNRKSQNSRKQKSKKKKR